MAEWIHEWRHECTRDKEPLCLRHGDLSPAQVYNSTILDQRLSDTVFSDSGGGRHPQELLLLSGDIELNPGPKTKSTSRSDFKSAFIDVMNNDSQSNSSVSFISTPEHSPPNSELHLGLNNQSEPSGDQDQHPICSNAEGSEVKDVHIEWADGRTSWVKLGKLKFEGDLDIGLLVKVKWGKHKKLFEGKRPFLTSP